MDPEKSEGRWIFRAWIMRDGKRDYARSHGLRCWKIWLPSKSTSQP